MTCKQMLRNAAVLTFALALLPCSLARTHAAPSGVAAPPNQAAQPAARARRKQRRTRKRSRKPATPAVVLAPRVLPPDAGAPNAKTSPRPVRPTLESDPMLIPPDTRPLPYGDPKNTSMQGQGDSAAEGDCGGGPRNYTGPCRGGNTGGGDRTEGGGGPGSGYPVDYSRVFSLNEVTRKAVLTSKPEPGYTEEARQNQTEGTVRLKLVLSASGEVTDISVVKGLPDGLTVKAIEAARRIKFRPAQKDGRTVSQWAFIEYTFNLY